MRHQARNVLTYDRFAEDRAVQNVAQSSVRAAIHTLKAEFLHPSLVRSDGRAFHPDAIQSDGVGRINRHLIIGLIAVFYSQIIIFQIDIEIGKDELFLDETPDNAGHLVPVQLDNRSLDLNLCHNILSAEPAGAGSPVFRNGRTIAPHA